jgi:BirA family transcriptional regulator, biotin operon repressor / biotin---[acetyl-CoA-carboxylase] ligase
MTPQSKKSSDPLAPSLAAVPFLSADDIRERTFVRRVEIHATLDSTNNRAAELSRDPDIKLPALVIARLQTAGRGRGTNKWWSADGALTFSLLIDPAAHGIAAANWPQLSLTTAVAVCDALAPHLTPLPAGSSQVHSTPQRAGASSPPISHTISVKWPNDVLVEDRKIAGILLESPGGAAPAKDRLIVGIGINVNNQPQTADCNLSGTATSLCEVTDKAHDLNEIFIDVLRAIDDRVQQLATHDGRLPAAWRSLCWLTNQMVSVTAKGKSTTGRCLAIGEDGLLEVEAPPHTRRFASGTVRIISGHSSEEPQS